MTFDLLFQQAPRYGRALFLATTQFQTSVTHHCVKTLWKMQKKVWVSFYLHQRLYHLCNLLSNAPGSDSTKVVSWAAFKTSRISPSLAPCFP